MSGPLLQWTKDHERVCRRIAGNTAVVKFVTKVRDDAASLREWIAHHAPVAGLENLIVFDNMSADPETLALYAEYGNTLNVVQFSGFHNMIHRVDAFTPLYDALRRSARYYQFIDVDEYLVHVDTDFSYSASRAAEILADLDHPVIPGIWLDSQPGYADRFIFNRHGGRLGADLRGGKPLIHHAVPVRGTICHNFQVPADLYGTVSSAFFVLHRKFSSPQQRISANLAKLRAYNVLQDADGVDAALAIDPAPIRSRNARTWLAEIARLSSAPDAAPEDDAPLTPGRIRFTADGQIAFGAPWQEDLMQTLLTSPERVLQSIFKPA